PLIVFSLVLGGVLLVIGTRGTPVIAVADGLFEAIMMMVRLAMWLAPVGIMALVAVKVGTSDNLGAELERRASYFAVVVGGLAIHVMLVLPFILWCVTGRNPIAYARGMGKALATAFTTASSNATMPLTLE